MSDGKDKGVQEAVKNIGRTARSRARNMRFEITLIATFYNVEPLMPAALAFHELRRTGR